LKDNNNNNTKSFTRGNNTANQYYCDYEHE